jgi:hypothetical protein
MKRSVSFRLLPNPPVGRILQAPNGQNLGGPKKELKGGWRMLSYYVSAMLRSWKNSGQIQKPGHIWPKRLAILPLWSAVASGQNYARQRLVWAYCSIIALNSDE